MASIVWTHVMPKFCVAQSLSSVLSSAVIALLNTALRSETGPAFSTAAYTAGKVDLGLHASAGGLADLEWHMLRDIVTAGVLQSASNEY